LRQHIEQVFMEGYAHGKAGTAGVPTNNRMIPTPRGSLESWLPMHHLASIYQAGVDFAAHKADDVLRIQQSLDQVTSMIYARIGIGLTEAYSATLLIHPEGDEDDAQLPPAEAPAPALPGSEPAADMNMLQPDLSGLNSAPQAAGITQASEQEARPVAA